MSDHALAWAFDTAVRPPATKLVLLALARLADPDGRCSPLLPRVAAMCSLSEHATAQALEDLKSIGLLTTTGDVITLAVPGVKRRELPIPDRNAPVAQQLKAFETFWHLYPNPTGTRSALAAWARAVRAHVPAHALIEAAADLDPRDAPEAALWLDQQAQQWKEEGR